MSINLRTATDEHLVTILTVRDAEDVYAELFRRYQKKIYLWSFNYTHDVEEAVDCSQEIFIKVFKNIAGFAGQSSFATWVYRIAKNHCLSRLALKGDTWRKRLMSLDNCEVADSTLVDHLQGMELERELEHLLVAAREKMKEDELEAFVLHYREGLTVKEITKILGCDNVTGARTLIQNARRKFQRLVKGKDFSHG